MSAANDEVVETNRTEAQSLNVQEAASASVPKDMEGAIKSPGWDKYPNRACRGLVFAFACRARTNHVEALGLDVQGANSSVDDLLDAHERAER